MKSKKSSFLAFGFFFICFSIVVNGQIQPGIYFTETDNLVHELKIADNYLIHSVYEKSPAKFIKTLGGFYTIDNENLHVTLEFNSNFKNDGLTDMVIPFTLDKDKLIIKTDSELTLNQAESLEQELDGEWLFATRGPDEGQERRGEANTRKTLKYLQDGRFQWIAYDTDGMQFKGSGGGSYSSQNGVYTENIEYFSRDNSRVGASLKFDYEIKEGDWHHTGKNSKGEPMYEIWTRRE